MSIASELDALGRRLMRVENALADAQARIPGLRQEAGAIRAQLATVASADPDDDGSVRSHT